MRSFLKTLCFTLFALSAAAKAHAKVDVDAGLCRYCELASNSDSKVAVSWYAGFHANEGFPVSDISWNKYTHITYSFAITTPDVRMLTLNGSSPEVLPQFVAEAKKHGVKALVSVGGWTGSMHFSSYVATAENRTQFVKTLTKFAQQYELDGLDFDWEYPGRQGIGCNTVSPSDTANFLALLQELRQDPVGAKLTLTAAVAVTPFTGPDGTPLNDVSAFAKVLDWVAIMNYDVWGPWSPTVGPNAPLDDSCAGAGRQLASATSSVNSWSAAGMPLNQIVLGVPAYGHSFSVNTTDAFVNGTRTLASYPNFNANERPVGDAWDDPAGSDVCGAAQLPGGNMNFWALVEQGLLTKDGNFAHGVPHSFDECSQTPYVYDENRQVMISFDNARSFAAKGRFIKSRDLRGFSIWEAGGDYSDILLDAIRQAAGY